MSMRVPITTWEVCPIKSRVMNVGERVVVEFDFRCPESIPCEGLEAKFTVWPPNLREGDSMWPPEVGLAEQRKILRAEPKEEVAQHLIPIVRLGTACGSCTRGGTRSLDETVATEAKGRLGRRGINLDAGVEQRESRLRRKTIQGRRSDRDRLARLRRKRARA